MSLSPKRLYRKRWTTPDNYPRCATDQPITQIKDAMVNNYMLKSSLTYQSRTESVLFHEANLYYFANSLYDPSAHSDISRSGVSRCVIMFGTTVVLRSPIHFPLNHDGAIHTQQKCQD